MEEKWEEGRSTEEQWEEQWEAQSMTEQQWEEQFEEQLKKQWETLAAVGGAVEAAARGQ